MIANYGENDFSISYFPSRRLLNIISWFGWAVIVEDVIYLEDNLSLLDPESCLQRSSYYIISHMI